jgi:magnesium transporter
MKKSPEIEVYLYDSKGLDEELDLEDVNLSKLGDNRLLWINILERNEKTIERVIKKLGVEKVPLESILNVGERPKLEKFEDFYRFFIVSVELKNNKNLKRAPIDFLVGKNFVITIHDNDVGYFDEFRERENGETQIGELDAESFVAIFLDLHIVSYFRALEIIESKVDKLDEEILKEKAIESIFLNEVVGLRADVAKLRRWFLPHRDVIYALSRPDFLPVAQSDSTESFRLLTQHFENAVDAIESGRDTILSLFDLYATKSAERMNVIIQRLTFITVMVGTLAVIAGVLGMNFKWQAFESETGFWITIAGMGLFTILLTTIARWRQWI